MSEAAYAQIPQAVQTVDSPVNNEEQATLETTRVLFFAHDTTTDREKRELPFKEFGGIHLPNIAALRDAKHMLYKCQLTQLPPFKMVGDWDVMLPPEDRKHWAKSFTQTVIGTDGQSKTITISGFLESDARSVKEDGVFKQKRSNHLVFSKRYPLHEAREARKRHGMHAPGGVVEIEALQGASAQEIQEAQYFFFPNWTAITRGEDLLPTTTKDLEDHLKERIEAVKQMGWDGEKKAKYFSIGNAMIASCREFQRTAIEAIRQDEIVTKHAFTKGDTGVTNSPVTERYIEQTGTRRKEDLITGEASSTAELVREMRADREGNNALKLKELEIRERELAIREAELGLNKPKVEVQSPAPEESIADVTTSGAFADTNVCGHPTASGGACQRPIKEGQTGCAHHSDNFIAENNG